jgi:NADP-dependent 3-hydroxy acid dehydrogenase YdfG
MPLRITAAALEPDNSSIMVCGGSGVAMHTTRKLKDMGAWVWMLQRSEANRAEIEKMMAFCVKGDAMDPASIKKAMDSAHCQPFYAVPRTGSPQPHAAESMCADG